MERIAMSIKEQERAAVLRQVVDGVCTLRDAAGVLRVGYRQAKRLLQRYRADGARGLRHRGVGRRSNRGWPAAERGRVLALIRAHYGGTAARGAGQRFGPTLAAEHLWDDHGILVPVSTLRRWMLAAELWGRARKARPPHIRRPRRAAFGELLQLDGSFHDWFEGRAERPCLLSLIDDATGVQLSRFAAQETTWDALTLLRQWIEGHGIPRAVYVDRKTVYVRPPTSAELIAGRAPVTQFGRVCRRLGIAVIAANSPQAKGRVERNHGTGQDRLVKKLRLAKIGTIADANAFLASTYLPAHNRKFATAPAAVVNAHRPLPRAWRLDELVVLEEERQLRRDWVIQYNHRALQVSPTRAAQRHVAPGRRVLVRSTPGGPVRLVAVDPATHQEYPLAWTDVTDQPARAAVPEKPARAAVSATPPAPPVAAAGYTRSGKPLSAAQVAQRERWDRQTTAEINRRRAGRRVAAARATPTRRASRDPLHPPVR